MEDRLEPLSAARPWAMSPEQLVSELDVLVPWMVQAQAALLARVREVDARGIYREHGAASAAVWLSHRYLMGMPTAARYVRLAAAVGQAPGPVQDAVADGDVNLDQAETIVRAVGALPRDLGPDLRDQAGKELVGLAGEFDPAALKTLGEHILRVVAPDAADEVERLALERAEARAREARAFTMTPDPSGFGVRLSGRLTNEGAATVRAAIEPLCNPGRRSGSGSGSGVTAGSAFGDSDATAGAADGSAFGDSDATAGAAAGGTEDAVEAVPGGKAVPAPPDTRTAAQRRADALVEICGNGPDRPQVVVDIPYDVLARQLGAGTFENGDQVTPETARRMACDCRLLPIVFDGAGQPLDVGRMKRLVGGVLRQALVARDRGCTFPGCDRGPRWTEGHHIRPWAAGGPTALRNLALLCRHHHTLIHEPGGWTMHMGPDGFPTFVPPRHVDPQQIPCRNRYHRRQ